MSDKVAEALREAGWEEVPRNTVQVGEWFYDLDYEMSCFMDEEPDIDRRETVLVPPRPEPEYELGTVARLERLTITDDMIERAALAIAEVDEWPTNEELSGNLTGTRDDEFRDEHIDMARVALEAALGGHE